MVCRFFLSLADLLLLSFAMRLLLLLEPCLTIFLEAARAVVRVIRLPFLVIIFLIRAMGTLMGMFQLTQVRAFLADIARGAVSTTASRTMRE